MIYGNATSDFATALARLIKEPFSPELSLSRFTQSPSFPHNFRKSESTNVLLNLSQPFIIITGVSHFTVLLSTEADL